MSIDYDLAKELKEAGFPQDNALFYWSDHTAPSTYWAVSAMPEISNDFEDYAAPTLEELIEAIGEAFIELRLADDTWFAMAKSGKQYPLMDWVSGEGPTPLIATARLWLALNTK